MKEQEMYWDSLLKIRTTGRDDSHSDQYNYPYEATDYCVLERLANSGYINKRNHLVDYGCGKGRVDFFLSYQVRCKATGIEYDEKIYETAVNNQKNAVSRRVQFHLGKAQEYQILAEQDRFYFFNPFSVEILVKVLARIEESYYEDPREMFLFFYYPSDEYVSCLMTQDHLEFVDEISCMDMFPGENERERVLIFQCC